MALFEFLNGPFPRGFTLPYTYTNHIAAVLFIFPNATGRRMRNLDLPLLSL